MSLEQFFKTYKHAQLVFEPVRDAGGTFGGRIFFYGLPKKSNIQCELDAAIQQESNDLQHFQNFNVLWNDEKNAWCVVPFCNKEQATLLYGEFCAIQKRACPERLELRQSMSSQSADASRRSKTSKGANKRTVHDGALRMSSKQRKAASNADAMDLAAAVTVATTNDDSVRSDDPADKTPPNTSPDAVGDPAGSAGLAAATTTATTTTTAALACASVSGGDNACPSYEDYANVRPNSFDYLGVKIFSVRLADNGEEIWGYTVELNNDVANIGRGNAVIAKANVVKKKLENDTELKQYVTRFGDPVQVAAGRGALTYIPLFISSKNIAELKAYAERQGTVVGDMPVAVTTTTTTTTTTTAAALPAAAASAGGKKNAKKGKKTRKRKTKPKNAVETLSKPVTDTVTDSNFARAALLARRQRVHGSDSEDVSESSVDASESSVDARGDSAVVAKVAVAEVDYFTQHGLQRPEGIEMLELQFELDDENKGAILGRLQRGDLLVTDYDAEEEYARFGLDVLAAVVAQQARYSDRIRVLQAEKEAENQKLSDVRAKRLEAAAARKKELDDAKQTVEARRDVENIKANMHAELKRAVKARKASESATATTTTTTTTTAAADASADASAGLSEAASVGADTDSREITADALNADLFLAQRNSAEVAQAIRDGVIVVTNYDLDECYRGFDAVVLAAMRDAGLAVLGSAVDTDSDIAADVGENDSERDGTAADTAFTAGTATVAGSVTAQQIADSLLDYVQSRDVSKIDSLVTLFSKVTTLDIFDEKMTVTTPDGVELTNVDLQQVFEQCADDILKECLQQKKDELAAVGKARDDSADVNADGANVSEDGNKRDIVDDEARYGSVPSLKYTQTTPVAAARASRMAAQEAMDDARRAMSFDSGSAASRRRKRKAKKASGAAGKAKDVSAGVTGEVYYDNDHINQLLAKFAANRDDVVFESSWHDGATDTDGTVVPGYYTTSAGTPVASLDGKVYVTEVAGGQAVEKQCDGGASAADGSTHDYKNEPLRSKLQFAKAHGNGKLQIIPINLENHHWTLMLVRPSARDAEKAEIVLFDPLKVTQDASHRPGFNAACRAIARQVYKKAIVKYYNPDLQPDESSCGAYVVALARYAMDNADQGLHKILSEFVAQYGGEQGKRAEDVAAMRAAHTKALRADGGTAAATTTTTTTAAASAADVTTATANAAVVKEDAKLSRLSCGQLELLKAHLKEQIRCETNTSPEKPALEQQLQQVESELLRRQKRIDAAKENYKVVTRLNGYQLTDTMRRELYECTMKAIFDYNDAVVYYQHGSGGVDGDEQAFFDTHDLDAGIERVAGQFFKYFNGADSSGILKMGIAGFVGNLTKDEMQRPVNVYLSRNVYLEGVSVYQLAQLFGDKALQTYVKEHLERVGAGIDQRPLVLKQVNADDGSAHTVEQFASAALFHDYVARYNACKGENVIDLRRMGVVPVDSVDLPDLPNVASLEQQEREAAAAKERELRENERLKEVSELKACLTAFAKDGMEREVLSTIDTLLLKATNDELASIRISTFKPRLEDPYRITFSDATLLHVLKWYGKDALLQDVEGRCPDLSRQYCRFSGRYKDVTIERDVLRADRSRLKTSLKQKYLDIYAGKLERCIGSLNRGNMIEKHRELLNLIHDAPEGVLQNVTVKLDKTTKRGHRICLDNANILHAVQFCFKGQDRKALVDVIKGKCPQLADNPTNFEVEFNNFDSRLLKKLFPREGEGISIEPNGLTAAKGVVTPFYVCDLVDVVSAVNPYRDRRNLEGQQHGNYRSRVEDFASRTAVMEATGRVRHRHRSRRREATEPHGYVRQ